MEKIVKPAKQRMKNLVAAVLIFATAASLNACVRVTRYDMKPATLHTFEQAVEAAGNVTVGHGTVHVCSGSESFVLQRASITSHQLCGVRVSGTSQPMMSEDICFAASDTVRVGIAFNSTAFGYYSVPVFEDCD